MEAVKTCDGFGTFYRPGGEEEKGLVEIKTAGGEVVFKVFSYGRGVDWQEASGEEDED
jgi:hypothetical protein